jgi:hypothetical protein
MFLLAFMVHVGFRNEELSAHQSDRRISFAVFALSSSGSAAEGRYRWYALKSVFKLALYDPLVKSSIKW